MTRTGRGEVVVAHNDISFTQTGKVTFFKRAGISLSDWLRVPRPLLNPLRVGTSSRLRRDAP